MPCDTNVLYTPLESTFNGHDSVADNNGSIFIRLAVVGSRIKNHNPLLVARISVVFPIQIELLSILSQIFCCHGNKGWWWWNLSDIIQ